MVEVSIRRHLRLARIDTWKSHEEVWYSIEGALLEVESRTSLLFLVSPEVGGRATAARVGRESAPAVDSVEHREGIEPSNTGFADQRVSHFATGAHLVVMRAVSVERPPAQRLLLALRGKILLCQVPGFHRQPGSAAVGAFARIFHCGRRRHNHRLSNPPVSRN